MEEDPLCPGLGSSYKYIGGCCRRLKSPVPWSCEGFICMLLDIRVGPQVEKSPNLHITRDSTGSIHENVRGKKFDPKKVSLGWGDLI